MIRRRRKASQSDDEEETLSEDDHSDYSEDQEEDEEEDDEEDDEEQEEGVQQPVVGEQQPQQRQQEVPPARYKKQQGSVPRRSAEPKTEFRPKSKSKVTTTTTQAPQSQGAQSQGTESTEEVEGSDDQPKKEKDPAVVPTTGRFFMHDDRTSGSRGAPRPFRQNSKGVWNQDESAWVHDKFQSLQIDDRRGPKKTFYRKKSFNKDTDQADQQQYNKRNGTAHTVQQYRPKKQDNVSATEEYKPKQETFTNKQYQRKVSYQPKKQVIKEEPVVEHKTSQPHKRYSQRGAHKADETQSELITNNGPSISADRHVHRNASPTLQTGYTQEPRSVLPDIPVEYSGQYGGYMQYPYVQPNFPYHQYPYGAFVPPYSVVPDQGIQYYPPMPTYGALNDNQTRYSRKYQKPLQNTGTTFAPNEQQLQSDQTQPQLAPRRSHAIPIVDPAENVKSVSTTTST